ncbi:hypothetical protein HOLleu_26768 [Holothuria leucospilota]|uniref:Uncharacterized protein n=1 Tax=Holothuria leucospilota TaxID=206669 RepID=A0A9Q1BPJ9_HOLLE|nr:hypothetical protein HOLleu_26768 [Holothuria leucospilota]
MSNLNRARHYPTVSNTSFSEGKESEASAKRRKVSNSYGCKNWQPKDLPEGENPETQRQKIYDLKVMHELNVWDDNEVPVPMKTVYPTIRKMKNRQIFYHMHSLMNFLFCLKSYQEERGEKIADIESAKKESGDHSPDVPGLSLLLCSHLGDKSDEIFHLATRNSTVQEIEMDLKSTSPCIIIQGPNMHTGKEFMLAVDMVIVKTFESAMAMLFAIFFYLKHRVSSRRCDFFGVHPAVSSSKVT